MFPDRLKSPSVNELAFGYGAQIGAAGYAKIDLIKRDWKNFYATRLTQDVPKANTPLNIPVDLGVIQNTSDIKRNYRAVQFQGQWNPKRTQLGINYTWSKLRGNDEGETAGSGPVTNLPLNLYYPEYASYAQRLPVGYLSADQRHRLRAWAGYDVYAGPLGNLNASILQSYDSGRPYAAAFAADLLNYSGAPKLPGYVAGGPSTGTYYLNGSRDAYRLQGAWSTDLALNYGLPIWRAQLFVRATATNIFNKHALTGSPTGGGFSTTVNAAGNAAGFKPFNPFTDAPVAGVNYAFASNFGQATSFTGYQAARTYAGSFGVRF